SIAASSYSSGLAFASRASSVGGSNRRFSCSKASRAGSFDVTAYNSFGDGRPDGRGGQAVVRGNGLPERGPKLKRLPTGSHGRSCMPLMTPAADAYQAVTAVSTPIHPPSFTMLVLDAKLPMNSTISVISNVRKTPKTAAFTCVLHSSM